MMDPAAVREVEKRARSALRQDGIAIIIAGIAFAIMAPFFLDDRLGFLLILGTGLYVFLPAILKKRFVYPRIGYVRFKEKNAKSRKLLISTTLLMLFVIVLKLNAYNWLLPLYLGTVFGVIAFAIGYWHKTVIEYVISAIMFLSGIGGIIATARGNDPGLVTAIQFWVLAAILIPSGFFRLTRFLHKYPIHSEDASNSEASNARYINIQEVKQKVFRAMSQDGIDKILVGIVLILFPLILLNMVFLAILVVIGILSLILKGILRKKIIYNRIGYAKFSMHSDKKEILFTLLYLLIFVSLFFTVSIIELKTFMPLITVIVPACAFFTITHFRTRIKIDYFMSFLIFLSGIIGLIFASQGYDPSTVSAFQFSGLGVVFLAVGLVQLIYFLRKYPKQIVKASNAR